MGFKRRYQTYRKWSSTVDGFIPSVYQRAIRDSLEKRRQEGPCRLAVYAMDTIQAANL